MIRRYLVLPVLLIILFCGCHPPQSKLSDAIISDQTKPAITLYGRSCLSETERTDYDILLDAMQKQTIVTFPQPLSEKAFAAILQAIYADHPLLDEFAVTPNGMPVLSCTIVPPDLSILASREEAIRKASEPLLADLPENPIQRALVLHDRLLTHISYRNGTSIPDDSTVYGALVGKIAICDGYSKSYQYLCQQANLPCYMISGRSSRGIPHSWNMIQLAEGWRYVDTVWNESSYMRSYHDYFLISLDEILKEHIPAQNTPVLPSGDGDGYYELCGYSASSDSPKLLTEIANAFVNQLEDFPPIPEEKAMFIEIKLTGTQYLKGREFFQRSLFPIIAEINRIANEKSTHLLDTEAPIEYNFNDTTQVLTIFPVAKLQR